MNNQKRNGNFTSSEIVALTTNGKASGSFGKPFYTYVAETNMERRLNRSLTNEENARPLIWGKLCEQVAFDILGTAYKMCSQETIDHPTIDCWKGSPDCEKWVGTNEGYKLDAVVDIKCPMTLKSFCTLIDSFNTGGIQKVRDKHQDGEKYYWQLVSNAILIGVDFAELIVFMPYLDQLDTIRQYAHQKDGADIHKYYWVTMGLDEELPWISRNGAYQNVNVLRFEIPQSDKDFLTDRVISAQKMLNPYFETYEK